MRDITYKQKTLRTATARGTLHTGETGMSALRKAQVPKGDPFEITKTAIISGAKQTPDLIPYCHPIRLENLEVDFELQEESVTLTVTAEASEKTGMEMEAMTAVSVGLLNLYDLLKPIEEESEIGSVELLSKSGGYSEFRKRPVGDGDLSAGILRTIPDRNTDPDTRAGDLLEERLKTEGFTVVSRETVSVGNESIRDRLLEFCDNEINFVATLGGIGPGSEAVTADVTAKVIDRKIPGMAEAMRSYCQRRNPYGMFNRAISGRRDQSLVINFPGSADMTEFSLDALFPGLGQYFHCGEFEEPS